MSIGEKISELRKLNKMTQVELAKKSSISRSYLADIEKDRYNASVDTLKSIAESLGVNISELLSDSENLTEETSNKKDNLTNKDKKDIEKSLDATLKQLEEQDGLMLSGNPVDDNDWELIKSAIKNGLEYAKKMNKEKYTPKKYKK
ncbi:MULTISPECIES: helix-turn-helix transcriptional regulator [unclassified Clostridium]|uniref:helix-turn-helix domain-containing protein n=1 Tax=unclassified Clostridium TaxID=2614128 RepID=UPI00321647E4